MVTTLSQQKWFLICLLTEKKKLVILCVFEYNILCSIVGIRERSLFLSSQPPHPPPSTPPTSLPPCSTPFDAYQFRELDSNRSYFSRTKNLNIKLRQRCDNVYPRLKWCYTSLLRRSSKGNSYIADEKTGRGREVICAVGDALSGDVT